MAILSIFVSYFLVHVRYKLFAKIIAFLLFVISSAITLIGALTTNSVPPKVEAVGLKIKYGIPYALDFLNAGRSNSFTYNEFFRQYLTLKEYYFCVLGLICLIGLLVIFVFSYLEERKNADNIISK
jgi:hypothetical protein